MSRNDLVKKYNSYTSIILKECIIKMLEYKMEKFGKHYLMVFNYSLWNGRTKLVKNGSRKVIKTTICI